MSETKETKKSVDVTANVTTYDDVTTMEQKDIRKELRELSPRHGEMSLTERNCLECLSDGGKIVSDDREAKKRHYRHYMEFADGVTVSVRPDGFRYLVSQAKKYGLLVTKSDGDKVVTYSLPKNSDKLAYVKRLVTLFDNKR